MADQTNQKPQNEQRSQAQQPGAEQRAAQPATADKREYTVKHKIVQGGRDARKIIDPRTTRTLRLTDAEAKRLGDAVALKRDDESSR
jgi:hypothetical protein